jgi:hypothetical protein
LEKRSIPISWATEAHGSDVVVRLENSNEATFEQLVIEGSHRGIVARHSQPLPL